MDKRIMVLALTSGLTLAATPAWADGFQSYRICGGDTFTTCAAVEITVVGGNVTMKVWNLSGFNGTRAGTVFNSIGFYNMPHGLNFNPGTVTGQARSGDNPGNWQYQNGGSVAFSVQNRLIIPGDKDALRNGIASGCANATELSGTPPNLYQTPCNWDLSNPGDWVTFTFSFSGGTWDPSTSDIVLRGVDPNTGEVVECWTGTTAAGKDANCFAATISPEPVTLTLLATGLAGLSGASIFRRRKNRQLTN